jgi:DNA-directed RNA polymerase specialized sigma24 family protein
MSFGELMVALKPLSLDERLAVVLCHGLYPAHGMDLGDVGRLLGMTRERVKQMETSALRKIRRLLEPEYDPSGPSEGGDIFGRDARTDLGMLTDPSY